MMLPLQLLIMKVMLLIIMMQMLLLLLMMTLMSFPLLSMMNINVGAAFFSAGAELLNGNNADDDAIPCSC
jgi:hypothetical protein